MRFMMRTGLLILAIPSIALLFLPYAGGVSPWATVSAKQGFIEVSWLFALLGGPFFLSIPILIAQTRVLLKRPFSKGERATYRLLAFAALAAGLAFWGLIFNEQGFSKETILPIASWSISCAAAVGMMILSARQLNPEEATTVALQAAWLPNAILCAIAFWDGGWEIGAYLAAFTIVLYTVEITLSMRTNRRAGFSL
jgi:hypothetical protein